jgi:hypothetical protein
VKKDFNLPGPPPFHLGPDSTFYDKKRPTFPFFQHTRKMIPEKYPISRGDVLTIAG